MKTNKHHVVPKHAGGAGLPYNKMELPINVHKKVHKLDDMVELGLYDETIPREDAEFRSRFLKSGRTIFNIPIPLYRYTQHQDSMSKGIK